jgi:hypothetical protein
MLPKLKDICGTNGYTMDKLAERDPKVKTDINRDIIYKCALTLGSRGVAMISVDETWSALRLNNAGLRLQFSGFGCLDFQSDHFDVHSACAVRRVSRKVTLRYLVDEGVS